MTYTACLLGTLLMIFSANAQQITGTVFSGEREPLPGANVHWEGSRELITTDTNGKFTIAASQAGSRRLIASFVGFQNDTVEVPIGTNTVVFELTEGFILGEAVVRGRQRGSYISRINPIQTEVITTAGLLKMACCNLAESFENSASVTVGFADAVSGARQIQMLGLSGIYTQMLNENIPTLRGLSSAFGWNYIPGPWLESIQVSKGTSSVVNGYESTTGQINLEFKKPTHTDPFFLNLFWSDDMRMEANITSATQVSDKLWTGLLLHGSTEPKEHDKHDNGFMGMPKTQQINLFNRWMFEDWERGIESRTGIKFLVDERKGGQMSDKGDNRYRINIDNMNFSVFNKTGFTFGAKEGQSIGIINNFTHHDIKSLYGKKEYSGKQNTYYTNVLISSHIGNTSHNYVVGGSFLYDRFDESFEDNLPTNMTPRTQFSREEYVPGAFAQYTYSYVDRMIFILGARGDYNSHFGRFLFTPRTNLKYNITEDFIFRASAGIGYRSPNVIIENIGYLASSKKIDISSINNLDIEEAWNYGANLTYYIPMPEDKSFSVSIDYYRTDFVNQAIVDLESDVGEIKFYNLGGKSYANAWQIDVNVTPVRRFDIYLAFRYSETKISYGQAGEANFKTVDKPLAHRHRGLINLSYATNAERWKFDVTAQTIGKSRLPESNVVNDKWSRPYYPLFAQITKRTKRLDVYAGCENILDFKQKHPILGHDDPDPFGANFDASRVWGPIMGRKFYAGIRLTLGELK